MVTTLILALSSSCDEDLPIICLNRSKPDWYVEVNVEDLSLLLVDISIIVVNSSLVKFEKVNTVYLYALIRVVGALSIFNLRYSPLHHHVLLRH